MVKQNLFLFSEQFPFGVNSEKAFLSNEIKYLCENYNVTIIPRVISDKQTTFGDFIIDKTLADKLKKRKVLKMVMNSLFHPFLYMEIIRRGVFFWNLKRLKRLIYATGIFKIVFHWSKKIRTTDNCLFYSYWTNEITLGMAIRGKKMRVNTISRAHGHDLYEEYYDYLPLYNAILSNVTHVFLVCEFGLNYIKKEYEEFSDKFTKSYLGVSKAVKLSESSCDNIIRLVSCSHVIPLKRINLIFASLLRYVEKKHVIVEWDHFGSGESFSEVLNLVDTKNTENLKITLHGFVENNIVLNYYANKPVDIFITLTESEGLPVSLQEAQAYSIPVIATNVGGIGEIVNDEVGRLLKADPNKEDVVDAIDYILADRSRFIQMKNKSFQNWMRNFDESKNYKTFCKEISSFFS